MINLIPPVAKVQVRREYWWRVVSVWLMVLGTACLVVALLYIPTRVLITSQLAVFDESFKAAAADNQAFKTSEGLIKTANETARLLLSDQDTTTFTPIINEIYLLAGTAVVVESVTMSQSEGMLGPITVSGNAGTRADLAAFRDTLSASVLFTEATLPISNLAKDRDIDFTITITPAESDV